MSTIKSCFTSRFERGHLIQFDYSQLEVICLAFLSGCVNLRHDLLNGVDMHCMSASFMSGKSYIEIKKGVDAGETWARELRQKGKPLGFLVQYGGAAGLMAKQTGLPKADCNAFIKRYYDRYTGVGDWQMSLAHNVQANRQPSTHRIGGTMIDGKMVGGTPVGMSKVNSITRRRYTFIEQLAPAWMKAKTSFSPTQMKNFKIQGFATGDIVPMMLGRFNRWLKKEYPTVLIINTTHDSVMVDVPFNVTWSKFIADGIELLETAPMALKEVFDIDFDMPLKVEAELGDTWGGMTPWKRP